MSQQGKDSVKLDPSTVGKKIVSAIPKKRQDALKWNGWGYIDSRFLVLPNNELVFTGDRYPIEADVPLSHFKEYVMEKLNIDLDRKDPGIPLPQSYPEPVPCSEFLAKLQRLGIEYNQEGVDRMIRSHGQALHDIHALRTGQIKRIPDVVVFPTNHEQVVQVVQAATENDVAVIPYGGGTSVSGSASCPEWEQRPIALLDTSQMNRMLWIDKTNLVACFEAGIIGQDLEREMRQFGYTVGHEPDSFEFSSLGGWVATRASGMKKNNYGNIEDIVVKVKMVTTKGVLEKSVSVPRLSCGPDFDHIIFGSEGTLGVVTEVVLKIRPLPETKQYGSLVFPDFESGVRCLREVAKQRLQPASIRLIDNEQFAFGQALKPAGGFLGSLMSALQKAYITGVKGMDMEKLTVATLLFEGTSKDVKLHEKKIIAIAKAHGGFSAGSKNGEKGYILTFVIAYIRDLALDYSIVAESFETSVAWDRCETLCNNVKNRLKKECAKYGIKYYLVSCRVTQSYDAGACVYFYFGFNHTGFSDPVHVYETIEGFARDEVLASGGSISHHHGVGKIRARWYPQTVSDVGVSLYRATKHELDPKNIFAVGNFLPELQSNRSHPDGEEQHGSLVSKL